MKSRTTLVKTIQKDHRRALRGGGCTVNKRFLNPPEGHPGGLIGSLVCLCQAAMPTPPGLFYTDPDTGPDKRTEEKRGGWMDE